jgi:class 3 adenylate cyclase
MAEERLEMRLAAISSVDVVGYSRLMGVDETGTLARLKARRDLVDPLIAAHSSRILKLMGDGEAVEFASRRRRRDLRYRGPEANSRAQCRRPRKQSNLVPDRHQCRGHHRRRRRYLR